MQPRGEGEAQATWLHGGVAAPPASVVVRECNSQEKSYQHQTKQEIGKAVTQVIDELTAIYITCIHVYYHPYL